MRLTVVRSGSNLGQNGTARYQNDITAGPAGGQGVATAERALVAGAAGNVNVGVAVLVAVEVAVEVPVGLGWVVNGGVGRSGGEGAAECERFA
jgi:hypothetical protein